MGRGVGGAAGAQTGEVQIADDVAAEIDDRTVTAGQFTPGKVR